MTLKLKISGRVWIIYKGKTPVAEIHLDYSEQVDEIVLYADSSDDIQLQVLRLAASHAQQFVKNRRVPAMGGLMVAEYHENRLTTSDSYRLMDFGLIPEKIQQLDRETIVRELRHLQVDVIVAIHKTADEAIKAAVFQVGVPNLQYSLVPQRVIFENEMTLRFTVTKPNHFIFWNSQSVPTVKSWDLHVVPSYHPVMNGWKAVGMVNGATDAYIGHQAVRSIYCPKAAQANRHGSNFGTSWNHVKHPFYAVGREMVIRLISTKLRSAIGMEELTKLLRAALGLDKEYVEISGGFRAPMKCTHNRLNEIGRRSPWPEARNPREGHVARGSEEHCVWAYRILKEEGTLEKSHVPSWFITEDWLGVYEGAEVRHGLF